MSVDQTFYARDARDAVIDAIGLGRTAPITSIPLEANEVFVPRHKCATLCLRHSQASVHYQLVDGNTGQPVGDTVVGTGNPLELITPAMTEDRTFAIVAYKAGPQGPSEQVSRITRSLEATARVLVRIDVSQPARIVIDRERGICSPDAFGADVSDTSPRRIPYGRTLLVEMDGAQIGVDYSIETEAGETLSLSPVTPDHEGQTILLTSQPITCDDTTVRIRAQSHFAREDDILLDIRLPIAVGPNLSHRIAFSTPQPTDFGTGGAVALAQIEDRVTCRALSRPLDDADYRLPSMGVAEHTAVATRSNGLPDIAIPYGFPIGSTTPPSGFAPASDPQSVQAFDLYPTETDRFVVFEMTKHHSCAGQDFTTSAILDQALVQMVQPDTAPELRFDADLTEGTLTVQGGQTGVIYGLPDLDPAAQVYVHGPDRRQPERNRGVGQLAIGVDFALVEGGADGAITTTPNPRPSLTLPAEAPPQVVTATYALTGATVALSKSLALPSRAALQVQRTEADPTTLTVTATGCGPKDDLVLTLSGAPVTSPPSRQDETYVWHITSPELSSGEFELIATTPDPHHLTLRRIVRASFTAPDPE